VATIPQNVKMARLFMGIISLCFSFYFNTIAPNGGR
jgi:hypothetical protein